MDLSLRHPRVRLCHHDVSFMDAVFHDADRYVGLRDLC